MAAQSITDDAMPPTGSRGDWLIDRALRGAIAAMMALPYERRVATMGGLTARGIAPLAGYRRRALGNLALIRPDLPLGQRRRIADRVCDNLGRTLIENYSGDQFAAHLPATPTETGGMAALAQARDSGRPVIFVTGHFGNHEAPRRVLTAMGYRIGGLYRAMSNPWFNDHYAATMRDVSGPVFPKGRRGLTGFVRHLKSGGMATILFDLHDRDGVPIEFLGRPALTSTSAAELALRYDALLVPYFGIRKPDGIGFDIAVEPPIPASDPLAMTQAMTRRLEARITADPGQWFWVHNRWKTDTRKRPDTAA